MVTVAAPWHRVVEAGENAAMVTVGVTVTTSVVTAGPLQPAAEAVMVVVPLHEAAYVTAPVVALIVFPPVKLPASKEYVIPVEFEAVVIVVTVAAPWHRIAVAGEKAAMVTVGVTVTTSVVTAGPLQPAAEAVMVVVPLHEAE